MKKSGLKKGNYEPQGSRSFGIAGKIASTNPMGKTKAALTYPKSQSQRASIVFSTQSGVAEMRRAYCS